jgi:hypothetical protein
MWLEFRHGIEPPTNSKWQGLQKHEENSVFTWTMSGNKIYYILHQRCPTRLRSKLTIYDANNRKRKKKLNLKMLHSYKRNQVWFLGKHSKDTQIYDDEVSKPDKLYKLVD